MCDGVALFNKAGHLHGVASDRGTILLFASNVPFGRDKAWTAEPFSATRAEMQGFDETLYAKMSLKFKFAGVKVCSGKYAELASTPGPPAVPGVYWAFSAVTVPDWLIAAVLFVPTGRWLGRVSVRWRRRRGLCAQCGYDLRGSVGRCPECGAEVGAAVAMAG